MPHGAALHCNGNITTINAGTETFYVDHRSTAAGGHSFWLYLESNGLEGLQSGGDGIFLTECAFCWTDWCAHRSPDTLLST